MTGVPSVFRQYQVFTVLGLIGLGSLACTGEVAPTPKGGTGGSGQTGGSSAVGGGGAPGPVDLTNGGPKLRVLTQIEYRNAITDLLGPTSAEPRQPPVPFTPGNSSI